MLMMPIPPLRVTGGAFARGVDEAAVCRETLGYIAKNAVYTCGSSSNAEKNVRNALPTYRPSLPFNFEIARKKKGREKRFCADGRELLSQTGNAS